MSWLWFLVRRVCLFIFQFCCLFSGWGNLPSNLSCFLTCLRSPFLGVHTSLLSIRIQQGFNPIMVPFFLFYFVLFFSQPVKRNLHVKIFNSFKCSYFCDVSWTCNSFNMVLTKQTSWGCVCKNPNSEGNPHGLLLSAFLGVMKSLLCVLLSTQGGQVPTTFFGEEWKSLWLWARHLTLSCHTFNGDGSSASLRGLLYWKSVRRWNVLSDSDSKRHFSKY